MILGNTEAKKQKEGRGPTLGAPVPLYERRRMNERRDVGHVYIPGDRIAFQLAINHEANYKTPPKHY